jgi:competence protein ComGC
MIIKKNKAFLLVEVLVTVVIVSVAIVFINHAFSTCLKASGIANDYIKAVNFMQDKMFLFELDSESEDIEPEGSQQAYDAVFTWQMQRLPLEEEDIIEDYAYEDIGIERFKATLKWQRNNVERSIDILTYIDKPEEE